jgi:hypothetical protein
MSSPEQTIGPLSGDDAARMGGQRAVIERYLDQDPENLQRYQAAAGKLGLLRGLFEAGAFKPSQTHELQCMGVILGDAFVQDLGMEWVMVQDENGADPAVHLPGTTIILYPLTMISKRVERGEAIDVFDLFNGIAGQVEELTGQMT